MIGRTLGRYRITARLGQGGIATVWRAHDELLGRDIALKILADEFAGSPRVRTRFIHEAQTAALLGHPGIVAVYDAGECDGLTYIALSLIEGETLSELAARRLMPIAEAVRIVSAAAEALGHAHARGVIHRDVSGRNIMIASDGRVIVLDFGLALAAGVSRLTTSDRTMGTVAYMPPEVAAGRAGDVRGDLYGLGVVLYEALTGTYPFASERLEAMIFEILNAPPRPPRALRPDVPPELQRVVLRALARDPSQRYQAAEEMLADLRALDLDEPGAAEPAASREHGPEAGASVFSARSPESQGPAGVAAGSPQAHGGRPVPLYLGVMPFELQRASANSSEELTALAGRLPITLGAALARHAGVHVVSGDDAAARAGGDPLTLARRLGANALLRGCVGAAGTQARVTWAVVDPWQGLQWAGGVVDGSVQRPFELEDQVAASLVRGLGLGAAPLLESTGPRPKDPAAEDRMIQAQHYLERYDSEAATERAITILEELIASDGEDAVRCAALARAYLHKHKLTHQNVWEGRAAAAGERAACLDPEAPEVLLALGDLHFAAGQTADARAEYGRALEKRPELVEGLIGLARARSAGGDVPGAEKACRRAIALRPDDWRGHNLLGRVLYDRGQYAEAIEPWRRVVQLLPDSERGWRMLGSAFFHLDRFEDAAGAYHESIAIQPNAVANSSLGVVHYHLGQYAEAIRAFEKATALTPADPLTWANLGNAYHWIPGHEEPARVALERAIALMREHLERDPADPVGWSWLAGCLSNRHRHGEAIEAIGRAIELAPQDVECMARAGHVYFHAGNRPESLRWFRAAVHHGYGVGALVRSPGLAPLREDPQFLEILNVNPARAGMHHPSTTRSRRSRMSPKRRKRKPKKKATRKRATKKKATKKKATKKKPRKKKATKKRAAKKRARKKKPTTKKATKKKVSPPSTDVTVELRSNSDPSPPEPYLSMSAGDRIRWHSNDATPRSVKFTRWPFRTGGSDEPIPVPGNGYSRWCTIKQGLAVHVKYSYAVVPPRTDGPPGDPGVIPDD